MDFFNTRKTKNALDEWLSNRPQGSDNYGQAIGSALAAAVGRQPAAQAYNPATDANVQASRQNYRLMAQAAADTAAAGTKALSGGYNADYADSAAAQGYEQLLPGQYDNEQALRQLALQSISAENAAADAGIAGLLGAQQLEMGANQMAQAQWEAQRDFLTNEANMAQAEQDNFWSNVLNGLMWAADVAMQTYDNYKGYTQQEREWQAYLDQQALENERYEREYTDARADAEWEKTFAQEQWDAEKEQMAWEREQATKYYTGSGSSGGSGSSSGGGSGGGSGSGLSDSEWLDYFKAYQDAVLTGDPAADYLAAKLGISPNDMTGGGTVKYSPQTVEPWVSPTHVPGGSGAKYGGGKSLSAGLSGAMAAFRAGAKTEDVVEQLTMQGYTADQIA